MRALNTMIQFYQSNIVFSLLCGPLVAQILLKQKTMKISGSLHCLLRIMLSHCYRHIFELLGNSLVYDYNTKAYHNKLSRLLATTGYKFVFKRNQVESNITHFLNHYSKYNSIGYIRP